MSKSASRCSSVIVATVLQPPNSSTHGLPVG
jgi:hypothetical protein